MHVGLSTPSQYPVVSIVGNDGNSVDLSSSVSASGYNLRPTAALRTTASRMEAFFANSSILTSGRLSLVAIDIPAGTTVSSITFVSATTAAVTLTNQWFALYSSSLGLLRQTVDDGATAWAASTAKTLTLTSPYITTTNFHYLGIMVAAATVPTLAGVTGLASIHALPPITTGSSTTGLTTTAPATAAAITAAAVAPWGYVS